MGLWSPGYFYWENDSFKSNLLGIFFFFEITGSKNQGSSSILQGSVIDEVLEVGEKQSRQDIAKLRDAVD